MHHLCAFSPQTPLHSHIFPHSSSNYRQINVNPWRVLATDDRKPNFQVDQDKARQALNELDFQLESISKKKITPPKIKESTSLSNLKVQMRDEAPEVSGGVVGYVAFFLLVFSVFYNIVFVSVIKPYIDGSDEIVASNVTTIEASSIERQP